MAGSCVEASIDASASSQNSGSGIDDPISGNEWLRGWFGGGVRKRYVEVLQVGDIQIAIGGATPLQHQNIEFLRESGSKWASSCASSNYNVVICGCFCW